MTDPRVSVLIVNFRSTDRLRSCLAALADSTTAADTEVIVVDNASPDFDVSALRRDFPWAFFLPQPTNTTYTGGNNIAAARAHGEFVLLLNPDTVIAPDAIGRAIGALDAHAGLAAATGSLLEPDGTLQRYYRRLPTTLDIPVVLLPRLFAWTRRGRRYLMLDEPFDDPRLVEQPPGAFVLLRRRDGPTPLLDPVYLNYFSDVELDAHLRERGGVLFVPEARCTHERGGAGVRSSEWSERLRLHHDLTWGARWYFGRRVDKAGRAYLEAWLVIFWALRIVQVFMQRPRSTWHAIRTAFTALGGGPPAY